MYFITSLIATVVAVTLFFFFRDRKHLHLDVLSIIFGASTLMWLIDVIFTAAEGEAPLEFNAQDGWISLWTLVGGTFLWMLLSFILNNKDKTTTA